MWKKIKSDFERYPSQFKVIRKMVSIGLSVTLDDEDKAHIFCEDIEIKPNSLAHAINVDRRVVIDALERITRDQDLFRFFSHLRPVANLGKASSGIGMGVIQIISASASQPGIVAGVADIIAREGISIRQVIVDDPEIVDEPRAIIVTDAPIPAILLPDMRKVPGVDAVVIM